ARIGDAGLHLEAFFEDDDFVDVHAERGASAFRTVDRVVDDVRSVGTLFGHQQHAVLTNLLQADGAHHQAADERAFSIQGVVGELVDVRGVYDVRVDNQVVALGGEQSSGRG